MSVLDLMDKSSVAGDDEIEHYNLRGNTHESTGALRTNP